MARSSWGRARAFGPGFGVGPVASIGPPLLCGLEGRSTVRARRRGVEVRGGDPCSSTASGDL